LTKGETLQNYYESEGQVTLQDYLRVLYRGRWIIAISFLAVVASTVFFTLRMDPVYQVTTTIMIETEKSGISPFDVAGFSRRETIINNQVEILKSRSLAEEVVQRLIDRGYDGTFYLFGGKDNGRKLSVREVAEALRRSVEISPRRDTDLIDIKVQARDPEEAMIIANTVAEVYRERSIRESRGEVTEVRKFLETQVAKKEADLERSQDALKRYQEKERFIAPDEETKQLIEQWSEFGALYNQALTDLKTAEIRLAHLSAELASQAKDLSESVATVSSPLMEELRKQLAEYEAIHIRYISQGYPDDHPELLELRKKINNVKNRIKAEAERLVKGGLPVSDPLGFSQNLLEKILNLKVEVVADSARAMVLKRAVEGYEKRLQKLPEKSLQLARLQMAVDLDKRIYMMMKERLEETKVTEAGKIGTVSIVDPADKPLYPIKPRKKLNILLGVLVGLGLGVGITFLMEYVDTSLKTVEDIERFLGLSVLGIVPTIRSSENSKRSGKEDEAHVIESKLITHFEPRSPISEAYRSVRTNIQFSKTDEPIKAVLVTSAGPGEGKSTTVANLAITVAQMGMRTLLVDTDFRRPILHSIFGIDRSHGLTNAIVEGVDLSSLIRETGVDNLSLIPCGPIPPNPSELLGSKKMKELIEDMKSNFDFVLFDSPPVIAVTDAVVLGTEVDGVILVIQSGKVGREVITRAKALLENVNAKIIGSVLNNLDIENQYGYSHYYYYYYYYYGSGEGEKKKRRKETL